MFNKTIKESTQAFGKEHQCITLYEELSELEQAICKMLRFGWQGDDEQHIKIRDNFIEEIVDVMNLIEWFYAEVLNIELNKTSWKFFNENWSNEAILKQLLLQISLSKDNFYDMIFFNTFESNQEVCEEFEKTDFFDIELLYRELLCIIEEFSDSDEDFINFVIMQKAQEWAVYKHERNLKTIEEVMKNRK